MNKQRLIIFRNTTLYINTEVREVIGKEKLIATRRVKRVKAYLEDLA